MSNKDTSQGLAATEWHPAWWSRLRALGQSRLLKTSYVWLVLVPIAAHALASAPEVVDLVWPGQITLRLGVPFSWRCFYFAAVCCAVGDAVYALRCPAIVKHGEDHRTFTAAGKGFTQLRRYAEEIGARAPHPLEGRMVRMVAQLEPEEAPTVRPEQFWQVHDIAEKARPRWRLTCFAAYAVGLALFAYVAIENAVFVVRAVLS